MRNGTDAYPNPAFRKLLHDLTVRFVWMMVAFCLAAVLLRYV